MGVAPTGTRQLEDANVKLANPAPISRSIEICARSGLLEKARKRTLLA